MPGVPRKRVVLYGYAKEIVIRVGLINLKVLKKGEHYEEEKTHHTGRRPCR